MFPNSQSEKGGCLIIVYKVKHILCGKGECFCSSMAREIKQLHSCCSNVNSDSLQDISNAAINYISRRPINMMLRHSQACMP